MNCLADAKSYVITSFQTKNKGKNLEGGKKEKTQIFAKILCKLLKHISCCYVPA